jgi:hypothetical protein
MTQTSTITAPKLKSTLLGSNMPSKRKPIGVITYNKFTGQVAQCEVYSPYWVGETPTDIETNLYLIKSANQIRLGTAKYASLV